MNQTSRNSDKLNQAPDKAEVALLLIDVVNDLEFDGIESVLKADISLSTDLKLEQLAS